MNQNNNYLVIMVDGGFCSQLVKYTLGLFLKKALSVDIKYDISWFKSNGMDCDNKCKREFLIKKVFNDIDFEIATEAEILLAKKKNYFINKYPYKFCSELLTLEFPAYIDGYYESIVYMNQVKSQLYADLNFSKIHINNSNQKILSLIKSSDYSCAVHVRRGDFVNLGLAFLTPAYYLNAIRLIKARSSKEVHFFFFSNDMNYVKEDIISHCPDIKYTIVDANDNDTGYIDLFLISQCQSVISSNSSFGFWGAFLNINPNKCSILPSDWIPSKINSERKSAIIAHHLPNSTFLNKDGEIVQFNLTEKKFRACLKHLYSSDSNYLIEYNNRLNNNICAIYFSSNSAFTVLNKFATKDKTLNAHNYEWYDNRYNKAKKHIFLRDTKMSLYQYGINSFDSDIDSLLSLLKKETIDYKVVCIGALEGGYAAMLFSCLLDAEKCITFSPCLNVKEYVQNCRNYVHLSEFNNTEFDGLITKPTKYNDIKGYITNSDTVFYCVSLMYNDIDVSVFERLKDVCNCKFLRVSSEKYGLCFTRIMNNMIINCRKINKIFDNIYNSEFELLKKFPYFIRVIYFVKTKILTLRFHNLDC